MLSIVVEVSNNVVSFAKSRLKRPVVAQPLSLICELLPSDSWFAAGNTTSRELEAANTSIQMNTTGCVICFIATQVVGV